MKKIGTLLGIYLLAIDFEKAISLSVAGMENILGKEDSYRILADAFGT